MRTEPSIDPRPLTLDWHPLGYRTIDAFEVSTV